MEKAIGTDGGKTITVYGKDKADLKKKCKSAGIEVPESPGGQATADTNGRNAQGDTTDGQRN